MIQPEDSKTALFFMPDISGFSKFVETTEVEHSVHIIEELFEILLKINHLDLKLIELEGDALFLYSPKIPTMQALMAQVEDMLLAFHNHLQYYEHLRICDCGACMTATNLRLKFIVHIGKIHFLKVGSLEKPYGHAVNLTHRLLKNEVRDDQYVLLSEDATKYMNLQESETYNLQKISSTYDIGNLVYYYSHLNTPVMDNENVDLETKNNPSDHGDPDIRITQALPCQSETLYRLITDLNNRTLWDKVPAKLEFEENRVNRTGTIHNCIVGNREMRFETGKAYREGEAKIYTEHTADMPFIKKYTYYILLDSAGVNASRLEVLIFLETNALGKLLLNTFLVKRIRKNWESRIKELSILCVH